jgi:hypothetical protein
VIGKVRNAAIPRQFEMRAFRRDKRHLDGFQIVAEFAVFHKFYIITNDNEVKPWITMTGGVATN